MTILEILDQEDTKEFNETTDIDHNSTQGNN